MKKFIYIIIIIVLVVFGMKKYYYMQNYNTEMADTNTEAETMEDKKAMEDTNDETTTDDQSEEVASEEVKIVNIENTITYKQTDIQYGFSHSNEDYWRGFGPRDGAIHSVAISHTGPLTSFEDSDIRVWYFKEAPEKKENITYIALERGMVGVQANNPEDPDFKLILETVYEY